MFKKFMKTFAAAAVFTTVAIPYVTYADTASETYVEENVAFEFTTGEDFANPSQLDSYFKDFVSTANLVFEDGKRYADITFDGHSYAATALKVGSADGAPAEIISSTGSVETEDLVRIVRVELDESYETAIVLESQMGDFTFKFDFAEEDAAFDLTTGTPNDAYFALWIQNVDLVETVDGDRFAYVTLAGHSYAVESILVAGEEAEVISSEGTAETEDLTRVVRLPLDEISTGEMDINGGTAGSFTFTFNFADKEAEPTFEETLTDEFQNIDPNITAMVPAQFIIPAAFEYVQAKKTDAGIEFAFQTQDGSSDRGYIETVTFKQNDNVVAEVSAVDGEVANFTVPSLDGLGVEVLFVDSAGEEIVYVGLITDATVLVEDIIEEPLPFTDVKANIEEITALYNAGITTGTSETTFSPYKKIPRYQFAVMIARALDLEATTATKFTDVKGQWYEEEVQALQEIGIINGFSETRFGPEENITRQQAASMILKMLEYKGYEATTTAANLDYSDAEKVADYAKPALAELQAKDVMTGYKGAINPTGDLTREQMAKVLKRSLDLVNYDF